jgi:antimicrobial peptide system SdpA family protein
MIFSKQKFYKLTIVIFWFYLLFNILFYYNPLKFTFNTINSVKTFSFFPQGWGFFTKNPKEVMFLVYKEENGNFKKVVFENSSKENYFGFSKKIRYKNMEYSFLIDSYKGKWDKLNGDFVKKLKYIKVKDTIKLKKDFLVLTNGTYCLIKLNSIPFAWSNKNQEAFQPCEIAKIYVK